MTHIYGNKAYKGKWVAMKKYEPNPKVIASAETLDEVLKKAKEKGYDLPWITRIPEKILPMVGPYTSIK
ncbi:hypothetical protein HYW41_04450 [Candidatus Daviesbacteria bacterium]|nr:hypothetical protein [Candidatus Daviesbacteria bacterium]